jgi:His/Glu/Gln/Arg/opine family amino acid ABC transporter permease subunit
VVDLKGYGHLLIDGAWMTIGAGLVSLAVAIILGLVTAGAKLSRSPAARVIADTYTTVIRGVPQLVLLLLVFFGGTILLQRLFQLFGDDSYVEVNAFLAGVGTIGFVYGAFAAEVFRGAILAVPKGQLEAARACGMSRWLVMRRILLPQMWRFAIPGLGNVWLVLLKSTSLMSVVGLDELTRKSYVAAGATKLYFVFFAMAALIYLLLTIISMLLLQAMERYANRGVRRGV